MKLKEMFQANARRLLRDVDSVVEVHHTTAWQFLRKKVNILLSCVQTEQQLSGKTKKRKMMSLLLSYTKKSSWRFPESCSKSFSRASLVSRSRSLWTCKTAGSGVLNAQKLFLSHPKAHQRYSMVCCAIFEIEVIEPHSFEDGTLTRDK